MQHIKPTEKCNSFFEMSEIWAERFQMTLNANIHFLETTSTSQFVYKTNCSMLIALSAGGLHKITA